MYWSFLRRESCVIKVDTDLFEGESIAGGDESYFHRDLNILQASQLSEEIFDSFVDSLSLRDNKSSVGWK